MHIYAFGSLCRGEVTTDSDVDLLAITEGFDARFDPDTFSIYSYRRISKLWTEGNPFAWHLATETKLIFASDDHNFLMDLGPPSSYTKCTEDCLKFLRIYERAIEALKSRECSRVFELSVIFLAIRNFATCFSLGAINFPNFSRHSARKMGHRSLKLSDRAYQLLERSRILSTRATGRVVQSDEFEACFDEICEVSIWMNQLLSEIPFHGRI